MVAVVPAIVRLPAIFTVDPAAPMVMVLAEGEAVGVMGQKPSEFFVLV